MTGRFGVIDIPTTIQHGELLLLKGWLANYTGEVKWSVPGTQMQGVIDAFYARPDVDGYLARWVAEGATVSGFDLVMAFKDLPRGRYPLPLQLTDDSGLVVTAPGPEVINDAPLGKVFVESWSQRNPGAVSVKAWLGDEDGIASAVVQSDSGEVLAALDLQAADVSYKEIQPEDERVQGSPNPNLPTGELRLAEL